MSQVWLFLFSEGFPQQSFLWILRIALLLTIILVTLMDIPCTVHSEMYSQINISLHRNIQLKSVKSVELFIIQMVSTIMYLAVYIRYLTGELLCELGD